MVSFFLTMLMCIANSYHCLGTYCLIKKKKNLFYTKKEVFFSIYNVKVSLTQKVESFESQ